ncbi:Ribosomal RNA adenine methylase transferase [Penicillium cf. griseofulvum]|uniref:Ribosomal RNA adenine methylase transferase n=1 Tax=Penicillium cf. griseofulvum TaxID=2972120 RepID=A0A9W9T6U4_9EURO|nr:Ribosomal RNA adenine methylase transferase [Penicillium cf. griseofulvum]KAJ5422073.1 Ribosomal RNA adenine methylase transferase [Penicillium cf. griseofulvum]KAJ5428263.1 Ribosomal RNA adenine methylase transferase [Penicillium cf. griseofulvum]
MRVTARTPLARFPMTTKLYPVLKKHRGKVKPRPQYVSEDLLDNVLERVEPYLRRNQPVDILDLWPGCGLLSSKLNDLLQPRRHVLVEPNRHFHPLLTPLTKSKSCYKIVNESIYGKNDWSDFFANHLPEQGPENREAGIIPKNDTLLILANLPESVSATDHFRPGRWFLNFMNACITQTDLNLYGAVRVLATMPFGEVSGMLPRSVGERSRTGIFAETIGLHNIELVSPAEHERSTQWRGFDTLQNNRKRVAERAAAHGIITPPTRELPPLKAVPQAALRARKDVPHQPRVFAPLHDKIFSAIAAADALGIESAVQTTDPKAKELCRKRGIAYTQLARDNMACYTRHRLAEMTLEIDEVTRTFARAAADPKETVERLKALEDQIASLHSRYADFISSIHFTVLEKQAHTTDDARLTRISNNFDDAYLTHDRRPFEPLYIHPDETYPRGDPVGLVYFEANPNPPALKKVFDLPSEMVKAILDRYLVLLGCVGFRGKMSVAELLQTLFPLESINDHVKDIPALATFAGKRLKAGYGPMPLPDPTADPASTYQENVDYDLSGVRMRLLSVDTLLDIATKYERLPDKLDVITFSRALGASVTQAQLGDDTVKMKMR